MLKHIIKSLVFSQLVNHPLSTTMDKVCWCSIHAMGSTKDTSEQWKKMARFITPAFTSARKNGGYRKFVYCEGAAA